MHAMLYMYDTHSIPQAHGQLHAEHKENKNIFNTYPADHDYCRL